MMSQKPKLLGSVYIILGPIYKVSRLVCDISNIKIDISKEQLTNSKLHQPLIGAKSTEIQVITYVIIL